MRRTYDNFDALIFDCDGTLVDSMALHFRAWTAALQPQNVPFPESRFYALAGVPSEGIVATLAREHQRTLDVEHLSSQKEEAFIALIASVTAIEPVVNIARRYQGRIPMAVATGSPRDLATRELESIGVLTWFQALVAAEDVTRHKPAPDTFLEAARRLGIPPAKCCAFEDSDLGLQAIRAAGMTAVDIRTLIPSRASS